MQAMNASKAARPAKSPNPATRAQPAASVKDAKPLMAAKADRPPAAPALSGDDVATILKLVKGANSIELKLSVPATGHRATITGIGLAPVEAQPRQAFFFDTPDLALNKAGVVVRARRIQGGRADTVVKLRPVDPSTIDAELRRSAAFKVELDVMPGGKAATR
jgi:hypothetical protein